MQDTIAQKIAAGAVAAFGYATALFIVISLAYAAYLAALS